MHPSLRVEIGQIIFPKRNVNRFLEQLKKKRIKRLPDNYNKMKLAPRSNNFVTRREKHIMNNKTVVLRKWERCGTSPRDEVVGIRFEVLLKNAKEKLEEGEKSREEEKELSKNEVNEGRAQEETCSVKTRPEICTS